jgi:hypothetical protein
MYAAEVRTEFWIRPLGGSAALTARRRDFGDIKIQFRIADQRFSNDCINCVPGVARRCQCRCQSDLNKSSQRKLTDDKQVGRARGRADERKEREGAPRFLLKSAARCCDEMDLPFVQAAAANKRELPLAQIHRRELAGALQHRQLFAVLCSSQERQFDWPNSCRWKNE